MSDWVSLVSGPLGALAALAIFLWGFKQGWWSTGLEVKAWRDRAERAEKQVDTVLPAMEKLTSLVARTAEDQVEIARLTAALLKFMPIQDLPTGKRGSGGS